MTTQEMAQDYINALDTAGQETADKLLSESLSAVANGDNEVYQSMLNEVSKEVEAIFEARIPAQEAEVVVDGTDSE